ncbi:hypothetical protein LEP1GSC125_2214 [Leptospira mayottensis 200901122]|uniref:Uncharacterized protein n=1 Tax=Leptospira mayottensis 200901122 TaxID=1193010 RepID=A0AA87SX82_9LEPT|nr:hypothetical protein LEP1GSC125_2214 [Leptospira mayottensis 200901122]
MIFFHSDLSQTKPFLLFKRTVDIVWLIMGSAFFEKEFYFKSS